MKPDLPTSFEFDLIGASKPFLGYTSSVDKTIVSPQMAVRGSKNVYKKRSGTWASRCGMKRRGTADSTAAGVDSWFTWYTSKGDTRPIRVANSKLQVESTIADGSTKVWYDLLTSLTATDFSFAPWWDNTDKKDKLLFVQGDSSMYSWSGGICNIASGTVNTITKSGTTTFAEEGFASTGTITIGGVDYAYTGGTGTTTLTGVSPDASGISAGVGIAKVVTNSNTPASGFNTDFIKVAGNQVYCGSYTSRVIYLSKDDDFTDFTQATPRIPGDGGSTLLDSFPTGMAVRQGKVHIGGGTQDWHIINLIKGTTSTGTTVEDIGRDKKQVANLQAPKGHKFIDVVGDTIVFLAQDNQLRTYGDYRNLFQPAFPCLSQAIFDEMDEEDFTGGSVRAIGDYIYITAPLTGKVFLHQTRTNVDADGNVTAERFWHPYQQWNANTIDEIDGTVYALSSTNPQEYQIWDTMQWKDDSPSGEDLAYDCVLRMAYRNHGRRQGMISFDKLFVEGYISQGTNLNAYILYDYQGFTGIQNPVINSIEIPATFFIGSVAPAIGDAPIGDNPLGDGLTTESADQELLPKFKVVKSLTIENCTEYQLVIYSNAANSRWEVLSLGTNAQLETEQQITHLITK